MKAKWNDSCFDSFPLLNSVKQGAVDCLEISLNSVRIEKHAPVTPDRFMTYDA